MTAFSSIRRLGLKAALGAGLLASTSSLALAQQTYKFGLAMPLTGGQALYGNDQVKAAQWAVEAINANGGVNGKKLEMIVLDTQADPQVGIQAVNRLINVDKTPVFVTAWSGVVKAVAPLANDNKVVELSVGANSPDIATLGDYVYTTFPLADVDIRAVAQYSAKEMGKKRAAVLFINNETGIGSAEVYRDTFTKAGGQVVAYEAYDQKATDFTGPLLKIRAANAEIIHLQGLVSESPQVIAQARQLGINVPITSYSGIYNPKLIQQLGAAAEGVIATSLAPGSEGLCGALAEGNGPRAQRPALHPVSARHALSGGGGLRLPRQEGHRAHRRGLPQGNAGHQELRHAALRQGGLRGGPHGQQARLSRRGQRREVGRQGRREQQVTLTVSAGRGLPRRPASLLS